MQDGVCPSVEETIHALKTKLKDNPNSSGTDVSLEELQSFRTSLQFIISSYFASGKNMTVAEGALGALLELESARATLDRLGIGSTSSHASQSLDKAERYLASKTIEKGNLDAELEKQEVEVGRLRDALLAAEKRRDEIRERVSVLGAGITEGTRLVTDCSAKLKA